MLSHSRSETPQATLPARVIGIGNAGVHLADRLSMILSEGIEAVAMNTDAQSLAAAVTPRKSALGQKATRGLGAGGDPEVGREAARESLEEIRFAVEGASSVALLAGLGGGTGSGAICDVAAAARESGAFVLALVTMPFSFEGRRRALQASEALTALGRHAHAVIRFDNDRMADLASPKAGLEETFQASDALLADCVTSFLDMIQGRGPIPMTLGNLLEVLRGGASPTLFGRGESRGSNRAHEAVERALKSPLLDHGRLLDDARAIIAHVAGPPSLTYAETAAIMNEVSRQIPAEAQLFLSVSLTTDTSGPVSVTLMGNHAAASLSEAPAPTRSPTRPSPPSPPRKSQSSTSETPSAPEKTQEPASSVPEPSPERPVQEAENPPDLDGILHPQPPGRLFLDENLTLPEKKQNETEPPQRATRPATAPAPAKKPPAPPKIRQETLQFEPVARGRFEKSEPTIIEGEDLDVPTFLRLGRKL